MFDLLVEVVDAADGRITIGLPAGSLPAARYAYDVEVTDAGGTVTTWVAGALRVDRDVTNELAP